jgi:hypothetical protein
MKEIIDLIIKNFSPLFDAIWNSIVFWRATTLVSTLALLAGLKYREKIFDLIQLPKKIEHDKQLFVESNNILKEQQLLEFIEELGADHSYYFESSRHISRWIYYFDEVGHHYINTDLHKLNQILKKDLNNLINFLALHFFVYPNHGQDKDNFQLCMYPELNIDRGGSGDPKEEARYRQYTKQLNEKLDLTEISYVNFRNAIKKKLII